MFFSAVFGGILTHFFWSVIHKAELDAKDVLIDEAKQAKQWAENELDEAHAKLAGKSTASGKPLPAPPAIPDPPPPAP
jgi:hypothetical protein